MIGYFFSHFIDCEPEENAKYLEWKLNFTQILIKFQFQSQNYGQQIIHNVLHQYFAFQTVYLQAKSQLYRKNFSFRTHFCQNRSFSPTAETFPAIEIALIFLHSDSLPIFFSFCYETVSRFLFCVCAWIVNGSMQKNARWSCVCLCIHGERILDKGTNSLQFQ